jgi:mono/diheme cytochrome c family protein
MNGSIRAAVIAGAGVLTALCAVGAASIPAAVDPSLILTKSQTNYLLGCGGCHGETGVSNSRLVPDLRDQVGYYLATQAGREYLVRLPNVSFYTASNAELADILNYVIFTIGGNGVPPRAKPYTAAEVAKLRKQPLTEVSLVEYRGRLVSELIEKHGAPASLRFYTEQYER